MVLGPESRRTHETLERPRRVDATSKRVSAVVCHVFFTLVDVDAAVQPISGEPWRALAAFEPAGQVATAGARVARVGLTLVHVPALPFSEVAERTRATGKAPREVGAGLERVTQSTGCTLVHVFASSPIQNISRGARSALVKPFLVDASLQ